MSVVIGLAVFLVVVGGLAALGIMLWRGRKPEHDADGIDLIPYLVLALAVGVAGFSLASLARVSLTPDRLSALPPTSQIALALAGIVVAGPIAYFLWRRQAKRRATMPQGPGWPIYLAIVELVFLTAFFVAVSRVVDGLTSVAGSAKWTDLLVYGGLVAFHWWSERKEPPGDDAGELPRLAGSGVSLIALVGGAIATLDWLFSEVYEVIFGPSSVTVPEPGMSLALLLTAIPIWAYRWLPPWDDEVSLFRRVYLAAVTTASLTVAVGAGVALISALLSFLTGDTRWAAEHFDFYPAALAAGIAGLASWVYHRRAIGRERNGALRGYEYSMAAIGLATLVGSSVALVNEVLRPRFSTRGSSVALITLGCVVIASGAVWLLFWRKAQAAPRETEAPALQRRVFLIGMTVVTGLTAAGALIAALVVVFRAILGEVGEIANPLRLPLALALASGAAGWFLFSQIRKDDALKTRVAIKPFVVTVICSHPGELGRKLPDAATMRVLYRGDGIGAIDDEMADEIVTAVGSAPSLVWVEGDGFRVAPSRES